MQGSEILNLNVVGWEEVIYDKIQTSLDLFVSEGELEVNWRETGTGIKLIAGMGYDIRTNRAINKLTITGTGKIQVIGRG